MITRVDMTMGISVALYGIVGELLYDSEGKEREYPLSIKYALDRNLAIFGKDFKQVMSKRDELIKKYGKLDEKGEKYSLEEGTEEAKTAQEEFAEILDTGISHDLAQIEAEEVGAFKDTPLTKVDLELFIACLVHDPSLEKELGMTPKKSVEETKVEDIGQ